jgi:hypothetical protein
MKNENPLEKPKLGPPLKAITVWPAISNVTAISEPFGPGVVLVIFASANSEV